MKERELSRLIAYAEALDNLAKNKSTDTFPNKDHHHAAIAISKILKYSNYDFILFDDDLKGDIVNKDSVVSFRDSVIDFIRRGGNLKVVVSDKNDTDDLNLRYFFEALRELFKNQVELKLATPEFKSQMKTVYKEKINFCVGDADKYRLELFDNIEKKTRKAKGSFNDPKIAGELLKQFYEVYPICTEY
jgi:hypothetical protein